MIENILSAFRAFEFRNLFRISSFGFRILCIVASLASCTVAADRPAWYCLPDETFFVVRVPNLANFASTIQSRTKLGRVLGDEKRLAELEKLFREEGKEDWDALTTALAKLGLAPDDFSQAAAAEWGYALTATPRDGELLMLGLGWVECGQDTADKWLAALDRKLADQSDETTAVRREDLDLAGNTVIHLTIPLFDEESNSTTAKFGDVVIKPAPAADEGVPNQEGAADVRVEKAQRHLLIARRNERILLADATFDVDPTRTPPGLKDDSELETAQTIFAKFLAAHREDGEGVVGRWRQTPGMLETLPEGEVLVDVLVDVQPFVREELKTAADELKPFIHATGVESIGPIGYRTALDGTVLRSALFVSAPAPRKGLLALLDQPQLKPEPADWVRNDVVGYQQISFDLAQAYKTTAAMMRANYPRGEGSLNTLETQSAAFLQTDPATLLGSLGKTHTILTYLPAQEKNEAQQRANRDDAGAQSAMAFVWLMPDDTLWKRLLAMAAKAANRPLGAEQGFTGLRYEQGSFTAGWFVGNGYMILALGKGVTDKVLSNLRSPPRGNDSLRSTTFARRAAELLDVKTSLSYDLTDGAGILRFADTVIEQAFAEDDGDYTAKLREIWPSKQELEGSIGVSVSAASVDSEGLHYRSALDLPPP